jgi:hypothetical protein
MRESPTNSPPCEIANVPIQAEQPKPEALIYWSDPPALVLARLRALHGPEWWLS